MTKLFTLFTLITSVFLFSQEKEFKIDDLGFTDFVVVEKKATRKDVIYKRATEWISRNYKSDKVVLTKINNEFIRIEGEDKFYCRIDKYSELQSEYCYPTKYILEISVKDNKYKFDVVSIKAYVRNIGWTDITEFTQGTISLKGDDLKLIQKIPKYFNNLNISLSNYISNKTIDASKDW